MKKIISIAMIFLVTILASINLDAFASGIAEIISNGDTTFLIDTYGNVQGWGKNLKGEVGNGTTIDQYTPVSIDGLSNITEIIPNQDGYGYFFAINSSGQVYAWGYNGYGQLGLETTTNQLTPVLIPNLPEVSKIILNGYTTYAITTDGDVYAWGMNDYGQVGNNTKTTQRAPVKIQIDNVKSLTCKAKVVFALTESKEVYAWGRGDDYQTGTGDYTAAQLKPVQITGLSNVDEIITNGVTSFAICNDRQDVYSWGEGWASELGTYSERNRTPKRVWVLSDLNETIEELVIELRTGFAITSDNTLYGWGYNSYNQLGNGGTYNQGVPIKITNIPKVNQFIFNGNSGIVLGNDKCVYTWGKNPYGEVGRGDIYRQAYAEKLTVLGNNIEQIYNGNTSMYARDADGVLYGWGTNNLGQLGIGNIVRIVAPTAIAEFTDITGLEKIDNTIFASDAQDTVFGWGNNEYGQLGDSTNVTALSPIVITQNNVTTITGIGDVNSTVPIVGSISALEISITHPVSISYSIDPNSEESFICSDIQIQNNSKVPVKVTIESFEASLESDIIFEDVLPDSLDWESLSAQDSQRYIALGIMYSDKTNWLESQQNMINPIYAIEINNNYIGALSSGEIGTLNLCCSHGTAFNGSFSAKHELIFIISLL